MVFDGSGLACSSTFVVLTVREVVWTVHGVQETYGQRIVGSGQGDQGLVEGKGGTVDVTQESQGSAVGVL
jgi:hypothetical protein